MVSWSFSSSDDEDSSWVGSVVFSSWSSSSFCVVSDPLSGLVTSFSKLPSETTVWSSVTLSSGVAP